MLLIIALISLLPIWLPPGAGAELTTQPVEPSAANDISTIEPTVDTEYFGLAMEELGDSDGDGADEIAILDNKTGAHVYEWNTTSSNWEFQQGTWQTYVGKMKGCYDLACGDYNNDGFDDLIVSQPFASSGGLGGTNNGALYIFLGSAAGLEFDCNIRGDGDNAHFGYSMDTADFNGDGWDDLVVGSPGHENGTGACYIYSGAWFNATWNTYGGNVWPNPGTGYATWTVYGNETNTGLGVCVRNIGNFFEANSTNEDIAISVPNSDYMNLTMNTTCSIQVIRFKEEYIESTAISPTIIIRSEMEETLFGLDVCGCDINIDGKNEIITVGLNAENETEINLTSNRHTSSVFRFSAYDETGLQGYNYRIVLFYSLSNNDLRYDVRYNPNEQDGGNLMISIPNGDKRFMIVGYELDRLICGLIEPNWIRYGPTSINDSVSRQFGAKNFNGAEVVYKNIFQILTAYPLTENNMGACEVLGLTNIPPYTINLSFLKNPVLWYSEANITLEMTNTENKSQIITIFLFNGTYPTFQPRFSIVGEYHRLWFHPLEKKNISFLYNVEGREKINFSSVIIVSLDSKVDLTFYHEFEKGLTILPDSDNDRIPNSEDAFPSDPAASIDSDGDGHPDSWNPGMTEQNSTTGLTLDRYSNDPNRWKKETEDTGIVPIVIIAIIVVIIIAVLAIAFIIWKRRSGMNQEPSRKVRPVKRSR